MKRALLLTALLVFGCDKLLKKHDAGAEGGAATQGPATAATDTSQAAETGAPAASAIVDAGVAPLAANESDVKRLPSEEKIDEDATLEWAKADARAEPGTGKLVATLTKGTKAHFVARAGHSVLATFPDPTDASKTLLGWITENAFVAGTAPIAGAVLKHPDGGVIATARSAGVCAAGLTLLFGDDAFCGKTCKVDKDCTGGQVCGQQAKPITAAGMGAPVAVCSKQRAVAGATPDAGATGAPATTATSTTTTTAASPSVAPVNPFAAGRARHP